MLKTFWQPFVMMIYVGFCLGFKSILDKSWGYRASSEVPC